MNYFKSLFLVFLLMGSLTSPAVAGIYLSVNPIDGGSGIRFERVLPGLKNTKQLQIRVSSNDGKRYQVFQRVFEPITNEKGESLSLAAIETATLANSNTSGTLYMQNGDHLGYSEQLVYTSGQGGESDSFMIAYNASPDLINAGGNYRGKLVFTVRSLGSSDQTESVVDFFLQSEAQLKISVTGGNDLKRIRIKDTDTSQEKADFVKVSFSNNGAQELKVYQEFIDFPTNQAGTELPLDAINISVEGSSSSIRSSERESLPHGRSLLYSGTADSDEFAVYFLVDSEKLQEADAGTYKGRMKYSVEGSQGHQEFILDFELQIQPIFTINVSLPAEGISFGHVLASSPSQQKQVEVIVRSNLHKPYQVMQSMPSLMTNKEGKEFDKSHFTFKIDMASNQKGHTKYTDFSPVELGEYPVYMSDARGHSVTFTVVYQLQGYFNMSAGDFVAPLKFSLNQN